MTDRRYCDYRDGEILDTIIRTGGISPLWLKSNRNRPAALERLLDDGVIRAVPGSWQHFTRYEIVPAAPPTLWERFARWVKGVQHD